MTLRTRSQCSFLVIVARVTRVLRVSGRAPSLRAIALGILALASCTAAPQKPGLAAANAATSKDTLERSFDGPGFSLRLSPLANLLFHLDCLSDTVLCSPSGYQALWKKLGLDSADEAALARWNTLRSHHSGVMLADATLVAAPLLVTGTFIDLAERQRIAALRARSLDEFEASVALFSNDADAQELRRIAERFEPRFTSFWEHSSSGMSVYFEEMAELLSEPYLRQTMERLSRFYEHPAKSTQTYRIHLIVQPPTLEPSSTAYQLEGDFVVEAAADGKASDVIDVVVHELCHALLHRMPPSAKLALVQAFVARDDAFALVDYGLFDEALATGFGNGLVYRHYNPGKDFAQHSARGFRSRYKSAGALAAAFFPRLEALLSSDLTVTSPEVLLTLGEAARASYRAHGPAPIDYLHSHVLAAAPPMRAAADRVRDAAFAGFPYLREFRELDGEAQRYVSDHPLLNAAVYLPSNADLDALLAPLGVASARIAELRSKAALSRGLVYALPRTPKSYLFVFLARDAESANELAQAFTTLREMREGALIEQLH